MGSGLEEKSMKVKMEKALLDLADDGYRVIEGSNISEVNPKFRLVAKKRLNPDGSTKMNDYKIVEFNNGELET